MSSASQSYVELKGSDGLELLESVEDLLLRYGFSIDRGPWGPIAGYDREQIPDSLLREWREVFFRARNRLLAPLARATAALRGQRPEHVRMLIQKRERIAGAMAEREMRRRHGGPRKLPRQETRREQAGPDIFGPPGED